MKKIYVLLFIATNLISIGCSDDNDSSANSLANDPIIGEWAVEFTETVEIEGETFTYSFSGTFTFNDNGTAVQEGTITFEGESETESDAFTWENASSNPNFNSTTQNYIWYGEDSISATFSSDFNTVTIRDEEGSEVVCTRN